MQTQFSFQTKQFFYLDKVLKVVWAHAGEVLQEISAHVLQLQVLVLLLGGLQGAEHHSSQHQVQEHPGEDAEQGGAAHRRASAQLKRRLLSPSNSLAVGVAWIPAATETSQRHHRRWRRSLLVTFHLLLSGQTMISPVESDPRPAIPVILPLSLPFPLGLRTQDGFPGVVTSRGAVPFTVWGRRH